MVTERKRIKTGWIAAGALVATLVAGGVLWAVRWNEEHLFVKRWETVTVGMTKAEVEAVLGKPGFIQTDGNPHHGTGWYYTSIKHHFRLSSRSLFITRGATYTEYMVAFSEDGTVTEKVRTVTPMGEDGLKEMILGPGDAF